MFGSCLYLCFFERGHGIMFRIQRPIFHNFRQCFRTENDNHASVPLCIVCTRTVNANRASFQDREAVLFSVYIRSENEIRSSVSPVSRYPEILSSTGNALAQFCVGPSQCNRILCLRSAR